jgi:hypothetical protein
LSQRGKQMEDERINVRTKLSHYEWHAVRHEPANEMHVAAQPVQFRYGHWAALTARLTERGSKLGPPLDGVRAFACFHFNEHAPDGQAL